MNNNKKKNRYAFTAIQFIATFFCLTALFSVNILPNNITWIIFSTLAIFLIIKIIADTKVKKRGKKIAVNILSIIFSLIIFVGSFYFILAYNTLMQSSGQNTKIETISIVVLNNDEYKNVNDLKGKTFGIRDMINLDSTNYAINKINDKLHENIITSKYIDFNSQIQDLYNSKINAIILNEAYRDLIIETFSDFSDKTKVIYQVERKIVMDESSNQGIETVKKPFIVYITGIDTFGNISTTARSDVNILAVVDPDNKEILLINIPRDFYVEIDGGNGAKDKLTHAGFYGVDCSVKTLEKLFGIDINYYVKVNFTSVINIVDKLGGIQVNSMYAFNTTKGGYSIKKGDQLMNGQTALSFARERYKLPGGDRDRGKNQQAVIKGIIAKISSPAIITNMNSILQSVSEGVETDLSKQEISYLIQMQLTDMAKWNVTSISVDGTGANMSTYTCGSEKLYVMVPNQKIVQNAKDAINNIMVISEDSNEDKL